MNRSEQPIRAVVSTDDQPLIALHGVSKEYRGARGSVRALQDVSCDIERGEFVSVLGPSGCGKSTLLMMIAGLHPVSRGEIRIGGELVVRPYGELGIVFQQDVLMDWRTVLGNVLVQADFRKLPVSRYRDRAAALLQSVGLEGFERNRPFELSGGMRQRVAICRALLHDPPLLLMDEPFGALDALTRERMGLDLQQVWRGSEKTVVFVTHSIDEAVFLSDRVVVMTPRPGHIREILPIDLARPRGLEIRESPEFHELVNHIHNTFKEIGILS